MCFDNDNSQLNTEERYLHHIQPASVYRTIFDVVTQNHNYPKTLDNFIEDLKNNPNMSILYNDF